MTQQCPFTVSVDAGEYAATKCVLSMGHDGSHLGYIDCISWLTPDDIRADMRKAKITWLDDRKVPNVQ